MENSDDNEEVSWKEFNSSWIEPLKFSDIPNDWQSIFSESKISLVSENINQQTVHEDINQINNQYHEELLKNQEAENIVDSTSKDDEISFTEEATSSEEENKDDGRKNDLSEFGVDSHSPDLFSNENNLSNKDELLSTDNEDQEDDLEIPAFLRRQKN